MAQPLGSAPFVFAAGGETKVPFDFAQGRLSLRSGWQTKYHKERIRAQLRAAPFLFMEEKNNNSGREQIDVDDQPRFKSKVKGDGQECPSHTEVIDLQAVADNNPKRMGEAVEAAFLAKVCKLRIPVCKPWGDSERYDFVVDWGKGFWRVQVKGGAYCEGKKYQAGPGGTGKPFTKEDMDFVVVHIVPEDVWYVIPIEMAEGLVKLWFNPRSTRARFEKYREAWCLLDCPRKGRGRKDIPVRCRSEGVKVRCAVCPLR